MLLEVKIQERSISLRRLSCVMIPWNTISEVRNIGSHTIQIVADKRTHLIGFDCLPTGSFAVCFDAIEERTQLSNPTNEYS